MKNKFTLSEKAAEGSFVLQNQKPGKIVNGKFVEIDVSALSGADKKRFEDDLKRYTAERERRYGKGQLQKDLKTSQRVESEQEAKRKAAADAKRDADKLAANEKATPKDEFAQVRRKPVEDSPPKQTIVLAKKDGVEGKLDKATGKFTSGNFSDEEKARYAKFSKPKAPMSDPDGAVEKEKYLSSQDYKDDMKASADADAAYKASSTPENKAARDRANLKIWAKAHPRLAEVERLRNQQRAAGKNPYDKEFVTKVTAPVLYGYPNPKVPGSGRSVEDSKKMFPDTPEPAPAPAPGNETPEMKKVGDALSANPLPKKPVKKEAYDIVLDYLFSEGHVESISEAHYVMMQMDAKYIQSIIEGGFPGTPSTPRAGDAGTSGLKMIQTGGTTGYMNKHSGGNVLPKGTVNSIMKGDLMVKTKNNTNSNLA